MGYDVFLVKEAADGSTVPLGRYDEIRAYWESRITDCEWSNAKSGVGRVADCFLIEFTLNYVMPEKVLVENIQLTVRNAEELEQGLRFLCEPMGWTAIDEGDEEEGSEFVYRPGD